MSDVLLVLIAPRSIEEPLHDWLLEQGVVEFTEQEVLEHGAEERFENALDAVRGSRPRVVFEVATDDATAADLVAAARARWPCMGLRYRILALVDRGVIE